MKPSIGTLLMEWRIQAGMTVSYVARQSEISRSTLIRWESHVVIPCIPELSKVLTTLSVSDKQRIHALESIPKTRALLALTEAASTETIGLNRLLKAMRQRRKMSQSDLAKVVGVSQRAIGQWEQGVSWPEGQNLSVLLHTLGATPEEYIALSCGPCVVSINEFDSLDAVASGLKYLLRPSGFGLFDQLLDLHALALDASATHYASKEVVPGVAHELKGEVYAAYAQALQLQGRFQEALEYCKRALAIPTGCRRPRYVNRALVIRADTMIKSGSHGLANALSDLQSLAESIGVPRSVSDYSYRTWIATTLADGHAKLLQPSEALECFNQATEFSRQHEMPSIELARWHAKLLNGLGFYHRAKEIAEDALCWSINSEYDSRRIPALRLERIRSLIELGQSVDLSTEMRIASDEIAELKIRHLEPQLGQLRMKLALHS